MSLSRRIIFNWLIVVTLLASAILPLVFPGQVSAAWYDTDWDYRKEITVTNASADYQTRILIGKTNAAVGEDVDCNGHIEDDFDDLRFTAADEVTLLDYWIESVVDSGGTKLATVWVENNGTPDTTLYMYYGNAAATSESDVTDTFIFGDHFTTNLDKWTIDSGATPADYTLDTVNSLLKFKRGTADTKIKSDNAYAVGKRMRFRVKADDTGATLIGYVGLCNTYSDAKDDNILLNTYSDSKLYWTTYEENIQDSAGWKNQAFTPGQWYIVEFDWYSTGVKVYIDDVLKDTFTNKVPNESLNARLEAYGTTDYTYVDWVFISSYATTEPSFAYGGEETAPVIPTIITQAATNTEETTATYNANITSLGTYSNVDQRGFAWGTTSNATTPGTGIAPPASYTSNWSETGTFSTGTYSYNATGLTQADTSYVRAYTHNATSWYWSTTEISLFTKPAEPTGLVLTAGDGQIQVDWTKATGGTGVTIYTMVRYNTGAYPANITDGNLTYNGTLATTTQAGLVNGTTYYFRLWTWAYEGALGQWSDTYLQGTAVPVSPPTVVTRYCSGFTHTEAVLNGETITLGGVPNFDGYGFDYGITSGYGSSETTTATLGLGLFSLTLDSLSPATPYHWRAKASYNGTWYYGADATFSTKGSPVEYEYLDTGGANDGTNIYGINWAYQTFTTNTTDIAHSITSVWLYMKRTGTTPGTVTASIKYTANCTTTASCYCLPTGTDLTNGTFNGDAVSTTYNWIEFTMSPEVCLSANTTYAIVVRATDGDNANYINWQETSTSSYPGGNFGNSANSGITWTANCTADKLFQNWGNPCMEIISAKVFSSYINDGDWLITVHYKNTYPPYYSEGYDVSSLFYLQLVDGTTVQAQTKVPSWGYRPGCIYLAASEVTALTYGSAYKVRMYGNFSPYPYVDYTLLGTDWRGDDLTLLDAWVRSTAVLMENYYGTTLTSYIAGKGITLNEDGGVVFSDGISELDSIRPNLFQIVSTTPSQDVGEYAQTNRPVWQVAWGSQITASLTQVGNLFNLDGQAIGALVAFAFYAVVAALAFPGGTAAAAIGIPFVILIGAWSTGFIAMAILGVVLSIAAFFLVYQMWIRNG